MEEPKLSFVGYTEDGNVTKGWLPLENIVSDLEAFQAGVDRANELAFHMLTRDDFPMFIRVMSDVQTDKGKSVYAGFMQQIAHMIAECAI